MWSRELLFFKAMSEGGTSPNLPNKREAPQGYPVPAVSHKSLLLRRLNRSDNQSDLTAALSTLPDYNQRAKTELLFLSGKIDDDSLLKTATAETNPILKARFFYFLAVNRLLSGDKSTARDFFSQSISVSSSVRSTPTSPNDIAALCRAELKRP